MLKRILWREVIRKSSTTTVDKGEIQHFKNFSNDWWDEMGSMRPLHSFNKLRIPFITDGLINTQKISSSHRNNPTPLENISILDIGCGGGILSEPLARIGANVTGLDANPDLIESAKNHAQHEKLTNIQYMCGTIESHTETNSNLYDAIVASEVVEHITEKDLFINKCLKCLKPGGSIFITTMSKTFLANFLGIFVTENICNLLPKGTHDFEKFIEPHKLQRILEDGNCKTILVHGLGYNIFSNEWFWMQDTSVNYAIHAVKL